MGLRTYLCPLIYIRKERIYNHRTHPMCVRPLSGKKKLLTVGIMCPNRHTSVVQTPHYYRNLRRLHPIIASKSLKISHAA